MGRGGGIIIRHTRSRYILYLCSLKHSPASVDLAVTPLLYPISLISTHDPKQNVPRSHTTSHETRTRYYELIKVYSISYSL